MKKILLSFYSIMICASLIACNNPCEDGHEWIEATCTEGKYCSVCAIKDSEPLNHNFGEAVITIEATCSKVGTKTFTCSTCGYEKEEEIDKLAHNPGEWEIILQPTANRNGKKAQKCLVCQTIVAEEEFEKSPAEIKNEYIAKCANYTYNEIARNPDIYEGEYAHFRGEIIQSIESGDSYTFRINITKVTSYSWTDTILVTYTKKDPLESRLLENDIVDLYGILGGTYTYETVLGNKMTIPLLYAEYVELN